MELAAAEEGHEQPNWHEDRIDRMDKKTKEELRPDLDKPTRAFLIKGIERDPNLRYQTPAEFRDALKRLPKQDW